MIELPTTKCETCGDSTTHRDHLCDGCWEVEHRLRGYLRSAEGRRRVAAALAAALEEGVRERRVLESLATTGTMSPVSDCLKLRGAAKEVLGL